jgi:hypothetical protein
MSSDPGAGDAAAANGMISLSFGKLFEKVNSLVLHKTVTSVFKPSAGPHNWHWPVQCQGL